MITGGGTGLTYQPDANYCNDPPGTTPDTFTYTLNGGSAATVSVTVTCVPTTRPRSTTPPPSPRTAAPTAIDVLANDTDLDGGPNTVELDDPAGQRDGRDHRRRHRAHLPARRELLQHPPGTTPDTFTYTLNGGSTATVSVTVTCVRRPADGRERHGHGGRGQRRHPIDVLANDTDPDAGRNDGRLGDRTGQRDGRDHRRRHRRSPTSPTRTTATARPAPPRTRSPTPSTAARRPRCRSR